LERAESEHGGDCTKLGLAYLVAIILGSLRYMHPHLKAQQVVATNGSISWCAGCAGCGYGEVEGAGNFK
jgi:hypothetical protein